MILLALIQVSCSRKASYEQVANICEATCITWAGDSDCYGKNARVAMLLCKAGCLLEWEKEIYGAHK